MRIRKNAGLGGSVPAGKLQPVVCQLNQSPWDVIPFGSHLIEFEYDGEDDSFAGNANGSAGNNSGGAVESVASPTDAEFKSPPNIHNLVVHDNDDISEQNGIALLDHKAADEDNKTTSFGQCKNKQGKKQRQSIYEHDNLSSVRSSKKAAAAALGGARRTRAQNAKKAPSGTSNPYEFYYYSGFGPLWGKRRGGRNGGSNNKSEVVTANGGEDSTITEANGATIIRSPSSSSRIDTGGFDYADDDDDDEMEEDYDDEEEGGKKRMRKPVKARSLKSLM